MKKINIAKTGTPVNVLMNTKAAAITERNFHDSSFLQSEVRKYRAAITLIDLWGDNYRASNDIHFTEYNEIVPTTLAGLKAQQSQLGHFKVSSNNCSSNDWSALTNIALRHLHDSQHIEHDLGMGADDELKLASLLADEIVKQVREGVKAVQMMLPSEIEPLLSMVHMVILKDFEGQTRYYANHGKFVSNQGLFLRTCIFNDECVFNNNRI